MGNENTEYKCSACKKIIKSQVVSCKQCIHTYLRPGCITKHRILDANEEIVTCKGPYDVFCAEDVEEAKEAISTKELSVVMLVAMVGRMMDLNESMKEEIKEMKKSIEEKNKRTKKIEERMEANNKRTREIEESMVENNKRTKKMDEEMKEMNKKMDKMMLKNEAEGMINKAQQDFVREAGRELREARKTLEGRTENRDMKSYSEITKRRKEGTIVVRPNKQQESEITKKVIKEKVDIKNMHVGISKFRKGNNGAVLIGCEVGKELETLKEIVQNKLGSDFKATESVPRKPKLKIVNIGRDEWEMDDKELLETIMKQNKIETDREGFHMKILKRVKRRGVEGERPNRTTKEEGSIIIELDENTRCVMTKEKKVNIGWKKCSVFEHFNVKRCYKCWGYYHIAKDCTREVTCHKCAGNHTVEKCTETKTRCVNCKHKIQKYNIKISDGHDALSKECPTYQRALMEEIRRTGTKDAQ